MPVEGKKPEKFGIVEEIVGFDMYTTILTVESNLLRITRVASDGEKNETFLDVKADKIMTLNKNTYIIKPKGT